MKSRLALMAAMTGVLLGWRPIRRPLSHPPRKALAKLPGCIPIGPPASMSRAKWRT